jgi:dolichol-phosphate mannosyltransferase
MSIRDMSASVLVVVPTYNERDNILNIIGRILHAECRPAVLVVDDASPDGTAALVAELAAQDDRVQLLRRRAKEGIGPAYRAGFRWALERGFAVIVQMDADGSHPPDQIDELVEQTRDAGLVLGSRYCPGGGVRDWGLRRRLLSRAGNIYARTVLRLPVRDVTGGYKAWRADTLATVDSLSVQANGYAFQIETTVSALRAGAVVREIPITFSDRIYGRSKMTAAITVEAIRSVHRMRRSTMAKKTSLGLRL